MEVVIERRSVVLNPQRRALAEQWRQDWVVNAEEGTTVKDLLDPGYWAHFAPELQQYDRIEVRLETGEWMAELIVLNVGRNYAHVHMAKLHEFVSATMVEPANAVTHRVEYKGPQRKHVVIRNSDNAILQEGFGPKTDAVEWMNNHIKVTAS